MDKKDFEFNVKIIEDKLSPKNTVYNKPSKPGTGGCGCGSVWLCFDFLCKN